MRDDRKYRVLLECVAKSNGCISQIWVRDISHANFIEGIQNGGLRYFGDERQKILNFQTEVVKAE